MSYTLTELRTISMDRLTQEHDAQARNTVMGVNYYLDELLRREVAAQEARIERMTETIRKLTWAIFVFTVVNTLAVLWEVFGSHG